MSDNMGHGWVVRNPSGLTARCGGPSICQQCQQEFWSATPEQKQDYLKRTDESKNQADTNTIAAFEGKRAWRNQIPVTDNPYSKDGSAHLAWQHGWLAANSAYTFSPPEGL